MFTLGDSSHTLSERSEDNLPAETRHSLNQLIIR
jgi:hypothetical protein